MEFWWGKEQLFPKILTTPKMEFLHSRKAKAFFGVGQSLPGSNSSGIEKFSKAISRPVSKKRALK